MARMAGMATYEPQKLPWWLVGHNLCFNLATTKCSQERVKLFTITTTPGLSEQKKIKCPKDFWDFSCRSSFLFVCFFNQHHYPIRRTSLKGVFPGYSFLFIFGAQPTKLANKPEIKWREEKTLFTYKIEVWNKQSWIIPGGHDKLLAQWRPFEGGSPLVLRGPLNILVFVSICEPRLWVNASQFAVWLWPVNWKQMKWNLFPFFLIFGW